MALTFKTPRIWVLVADRHASRVYNKTDAGVFLITKIVPGAHKMPKVTHRGGDRITGTGLYIVRHSKHGLHMQAPLEEEGLVAREVSAWLDTEVAKDSFDRLILVAEPRMLEELRRAIGKHVYAHIIAEISRDLSQLSEPDLRTEVGKILWF